MTKTAPPMHHADDAREMASRWHLVLLFWLILNFVLASTDQREEPPCGIILTSLRELRNLGGAVFETVCVNLPRGHREVIGVSREPIEGVDVIIAGTDSVVECRGGSASGEQTANGGDYSEFPLIFSSSNLVVIRGVLFKGCVRPLRFKWVTRIELTLSDFSNFSPGGVLDITNCPQVIVSNCTFTNNTSHGIGMNRYSGNAGAVSIGYDDTPRPDHHRNTPPFIRIAGSTFKMNTATALDDLQYEDVQVIGRNIYNQRGGGVACYFGASNYSADVEIKGCTFEDNYVRHSGGGVYMFMSGEDCAHSVHIQECEFVGNDATFGGGVQLSFDTSLSDLSNVLVNQAVVEDCVFSGNQATVGGGLSVVQINKQENLNSLTVQNCQFIDNGAQLGSAVSAQYIFTINFASLEKLIIIEDCTFSGNSALFGAVFASRNTVGFQGDVIFNENTGPAIQSFGSLLHFSGDVMFSSNRHHPNGFFGVINLAALGQIMLERGANVSFINNTGINGGMIVVKGRLSSARQLYNPQCFIQYENLTAPPPTWNVTMLFADNDAKIGPIVFASNFNACTWFDASSPFFNSDLRKGWSFMDIRDNYLLRNGVRVKSDYFFQTSVQRLSLSSPQDSMIMEVSPGDSIQVDVKALDRYDHDTTAFLEIKDAASDSAVDSDIVFDPSVVQTVAGEGRIQFRYLTNLTTGNTTVELVPSFIPEELPGLEITLVHNPCLPGYFLREEGECICEETDIVALCDSQRRGVVLVSGLWGAPPNWSRELVTYTCPSGYCDCSQSFDGEENIGCLLNYTDPNGICTEGRTGLLCGQCQEGYGVGLLTNQCKMFADKVPQFWLFPLYLGILVPLLVAIVRLGVHLPTLLRGFIFYVQISPIAVEYLPLTFLLRVDVMSCFASTLALYMPLDFNFHEGMTSLESYGLRYITPLVALIVVPIAFRVRRPISKYWFGVWTIIQLLYVMATATSASLLQCPTLTQSTLSGISKHTIWLYDGSVSCFSGGHVFLAIVAVLSLVALMLLIPLIAAAIHVDFLRTKVHSSFARLDNFSLALTRGFKEDCRWWPLMEISCRYIFVVASIFSVGRKVVPLVVSLLTFLLQFYTHPYEDTLANYMESLTLFTLVVLLALGDTTFLIRRANNVQSFTLWPIYYSPVLIGGVVATAYIIYHAVKIYKRNKDVIKRRYKELFARAQRKFSESHKSGAVKFVCQKQVTRTEVYLYYEDEDEEVYIDN